MGILIQEDSIEVRKDDKRFSLGETDVYESFAETTGELFRFLQKEYGRCTSFVYVGEKDPKKIGWVFQKKVKYEDCEEYYTREVWITLHKAQPEKSIEYHHLELS